jgi:hypothetical protein
MSPLTRRVLKQKPEKKSQPNSTKNVAILTTSPV